MHWEIVGQPAGMDHVDHINGDGLDNRRCNLRHATRSQNAINQDLSVRNKSGHRGVHWSKARKRWIAVISYERRQHYLGSFRTKEEAAEAYAKAAEKHHGEFRRVS